MRRVKSFGAYHGPAGGWGSARSLGGILSREGVLASGGLALTRQNKADGFMCVSCSWSKPAHALPFEFCENGAKATAWEITSRRCTPEFFGRHSVRDMRDWSDYDLEQVGRITHPVRYDGRKDKYVAVSWAAAFAEIGAELRRIRARDPKRVVFYSSGRTSNEASYMYGLFARLYGNNNLPDSSNMCHETTSVALPISIGVPVGTVTLDDFAHTDCILSFGQNVGTNAPRMLHPLQEAARRGCPIITYNPLRERGWERFTNPQSPSEMLTGEETRISTQYHQVKAGGDLAALTGICRAVFELDTAARADGRAPVIDDDFVAEHTLGFDSFRDSVMKWAWEELEQRSGLPRSAMEATALVYSRAKATMAIYGMGLTQHRAGVETVQVLVNLLLLRGNIGRPGAGICPVRGHSNVQGQRTVGISEKPELVPIDKMERQFGVKLARETGLNTVEACEKVLAGEIDGFFMFGGNFLHAVPDRDRMEPAWERIGLSVNVITKLNRTALFPGEVSYILPPLGRTEIDRQASGPQAVSMEDSLACIHGSRGVREPASRQLLSEPRIVAEFAKAALDPVPGIDWDAWVDDYRRIRAAIAESYPKDFHDYEGRMFQPGGFHRVLAACERKWNTKTGKANFVTPRALDEDKDMPERGPDVLRMITLRSNDQFNTTVYGYDDRFRGIVGTRMVVLMNRADMARLGFDEGETVRLMTDADDVARSMGGFRVTPYDIPPGCVGTYYPEANALIPLWHYAEGSKTPAAKSVPVRMRSESRAG